MWPPWALGWAGITLALCLYGTESQRATVKACFVVFSKAAGGSFQPRVYRRRTPKEAEEMERLSDAWKKELGKVSSGGLHFAPEVGSIQSSDDMSICTGSGEKRRRREWRRWETAAGELFWQRIQCINVLLLSVRLPLAPCLPTLFDQACETDTLCHPPLCSCFCEDAIFMSYYTVHTATSQLQPLCDVWYM